MADISAPGLAIQAIYAKDVDMEDDRPRPKSSTDTMGANLEALSVAELKERVTALQAEIARTEVEINKKQAQAAAAASFFK